MPTALPAPPAIVRFTEDELARAPHAFDEVLATLIARLARPGVDDSPDERSRAGELALALSSRRPRMVADFSAALALDAQRALQRRDTAPESSVPPAVPAKLALVDETAVIADVEIMRAAETIRVVAEHELRELAAFLSALAGESLVVPHHVVLHDRLQARALWSAAQLLPDQTDLRPQFMRQVAPPFAAVLRIQWAAACTRLEDAGIVPAAYRTVILHAGARVDPVQPPPGLAGSLDRAAGAPDPIGRRLAAASADAAATGPRSAEEARLAGLERIFDTLQTDARIEPDLRPAVERLRAPARRLAASDEALRQVAATHPLWALIDRIAWQGRTLPAPPQRERVRTMQVVNGLADLLAKETRPEAARFQWALERLLALEHNRFERQLARQQPQIAALEALDHELSGGASGAVRRSEFGHLPTVPSNLYDTMPMPMPAAALPPAEAWLDALVAGSVAELLIQGRWVLAQLLWRSASGELWLWSDCTGDELWPVRRGALCLLFQGGLAGSVEPGGVMRDLRARAARETAG